MKFKEIAARITGLSVPVFGIQWTPAEPEAAAARRVLAYLEDRRVLYVPHELENPGHCIRSVLDIRQFLTAEIGLLPADSALATPLRALRSACRKFLDASQRRPEIARYGMQHGHWASWEFGTALGELRGVAGLWIAILATRYGLDVEDDLAVILPADTRHG